MNFCNFDEFRKNINCKMYDDFIFFTNYLLRFKQRIKD